MTHIYNQGLYSQVRSYNRKIRNIETYTYNGRKSLVSSRQSDHQFPLQVPKKKCILTLGLNKLGILESLMSTGSLFHSFGPREEMVL